MCTVCGDVLNVSCEGVNGVAESVGEGDSLSVIGVCTNSSGMEDCVAGGNVPNGGE